MFVIFSADGFYLLDKSRSDIFIQVLDVEILVLPIEIKKQLLFILDIFIDSQEGWNLLREYMHQVLTWQILQKELCSLSAIFSETVKNTCNFLSGNIRTINISIILCVNFTIKVLISLNLIVNEFIVAVIVCFAVHVAICRG